MVLPAEYTEIIIHAQYDRCMSSSNRELRAGSWWNQDRLVCLESSRYMCLLINSEASKSYQDPWGSR